MLTRLWIKYAKELSRYNVLTILIPESSTGRQPIGFFFRDMFFISQWIHVVYTWVASLWLYHNAITPGRRRLTPYFVLLPRLHTDSPQDHIKVSLAHNSISQPVDWYDIPRRICIRFIYKLYVSQIISPKKKLSLSCYKSIWILHVDKIYSTNDQMQNIVRVCWCRPAQCMW